MRGARLLVGLCLALHCGCESGGRPSRPDGCSGHLSPLPEADGGAPACRQAWAGDLIINEVVLRPGGRDLDGDGHSDGHDELIELIANGDEPIHLAGAELRWSGKRRGGIRDSPCLEPGDVAVLVGSATGAFHVPPGAVRLQLDRTLRLSDSGGRLALHGGAGSELDAVQLTAANNPLNGCVTRQVEGDRWADMVAHASLPRAQGASWSPGLCAGGGRFPGCLQIEARTATQPAMDAGAR